MTATDGPDANCSRDDRPAALRSSYIHIDNSRKGFAMMHKNIAHTLIASTLLTAGLIVAPATYAFDEGKDFEALAKSIMKKMDENKDGMMSKEEVMKMVSEKFDKMDTKKTGKMDDKQFAEFLKELMKSGA